MTPEEWNAATDPTPMLEFLRGKASDRRLRLFAVACCRRIWHLLTGEQSRMAIELAERLADGLATNTDRRAAVEALERSRTRTTAEHDILRAAAYLAANQGSIRAASRVVAETGIPYFIAVPGDNSAQNPAWWREFESERTAQTGLLRDIVNPFSPPHFDPSWRTATVVALVNGIYHERAFERMPILGDALSEAGVPDDSELIRHSRAASPHHRGCWVLDLVLGKS